MSRLGFSDDQRAEWIKLVKAEWKRWSWNAAECDYRGKFTVPQHDRYRASVRHGVRRGHRSGAVHARKRSVAATASRQALKC